MNRARSCFFLLVATTVFDLAAMGNRESEPYAFGQVCTKEKDDSFVSLQNLAVRTAHGNPIPMVKNQKVLVFMRDEQKYRYGLFDSCATSQKKASVVFAYDEKDDSYIYDLFELNDVYLHSSWTYQQGKEPTIFFNKDFSVWSWDVLECDSRFLTPFDKDYVKQLIGRFIDACKKSAPEEWFDRKEGESPFFVQKHELHPNKKKGFWGTTVTWPEVILFGDIHGDSRALFSSLDTLIQDKKMKENFTLKEGVNLVFLGDYAGRGATGLEVWLTLFRLKIANPAHVFILRGNHEDSIMSEFEFDGFGEELKYKIHLSTKADRKDVFYRLYNFLPVALYLSYKEKKDGEIIQKNVLCCHGLPEIGFRAKEFLQDSDATHCRIGNLKRNDEVSQFSGEGFSSPKFIAVSEFVPDGEFKEKTPMLPIELGFLWHDVEPIDHEVVSDVVYIKNRGLRLSQKLVRLLMERDGVSATIRGHQHGLGGDLVDTLKNKHGYASTYDKLIRTIISGNFSGYGDNDCDYSFAQLERVEGRYKFRHYCKLLPQDW